MDIAVPVVAGLLGGWLFYRLWRQLLPRGYGRKFWAELPGELRTMVEAEESAEALRRYRGLMVGIARHAGRNLFAVLVGVAPLTIFCLLADLFMQEPEQRRLNPLAAYLEDFDFWVLVAATAGSLAAAWWYRSGRNAYGR